MVALASLTAFSGLVLYSVYHNCDPVTSGAISSYDKIMPYFAADKLSKFPGLTGLFVSGVFSASLSTISAVLNSLAAIAVEDYIKPFYEKKGKELSDAKVALFGKVLAITNGFACLAIAFLVGNFGSLVQATIAVTAAFNGPLLGIFTLGMFSERANEKGAIIGLVTAISFMVWIIFGMPKPPLSHLPFTTEGCNFTIAKNSTSILNARWGFLNSLFFIHTMFSRLKNILRICFIQFFIIPLHSWLLISECLAKTLPTSISIASPTCGTVL